MDGNDPMQDLRATVWVGKQGLSETVIGEVITQLKKRKMVKVKWLRNAEFDPVALARRAHATVIMVRGRTAVLEEQKRDNSRDIPGSRQG